MVDILEVKVAKSDVPHMALAGIRLDPRGVGRVNGCEIFKENIVDIVDGIVA